MKYFVDGKLLPEVTAAQVTEWAQKNREVDESYNSYVATAPINFWLDQEILPWSGIPNSKEDLERNTSEGKKEDGVVDFKIDYVRVWQKKN
ncbi:hypothetical protein N9192_00225 [Akkermansiaceae bacterium]|nr:hypothetical protein [Akkermansiaceae bacterium]